MCMYKDITIPSKYLSFQTYLLPFSHHTTTNTESCNIPQDCAWPSRCLMKMPRLETPSLVGISPARSLVNLSTNFLYTTSLTSFCLRPYISDPRKSIQSTQFHHRKPGPVPCTTCVQTYTRIRRRTWNHPGRSDGVYQLSRMDTLYTPFILRAVRPY